MYDFLVLIQYLYVYVAAANSLIPFESNAEEINNLLIFFVLV